MLHERETCSSLHKTKKCWKILCNEKRNEKRIKESNEKRVEKIATLQQQLKESNEKLKKSNEKNEFGTLMLNDAGTNIAMMQQQLKISATLQQQLKESNEKNEFGTLMLNDAGMNIAMMQQQLKISNEKIATLQQQLKESNEQTKMLKRRRVTPASLPRVSLSPVADAASTSEARGAPTIATTSAETRICAWCRKGGTKNPDVAKKLKLCSRCQCTNYCSLECQSKDWVKGHSTTCQPTSVDTTS